MLDKSFFTEAWLECHYVVMYFIKNNQELAEKTLENALENSKNTPTPHQIQLAKH